MTFHPNQSSIPSRFEEHVALHILKHVVYIAGIRTPLILGIHGPSGEGKTLQCELLFEKMGTVPFRISGNELESVNAGEPGKIISERYREATESIDSRSSRMAVLFINDIDAGIGRWGENVQYTVNIQNAVATLIHLADYTSRERQTGPRVPIIVTGNDFTTLYQPLMRLGRMSLFEWKPTLEEKIDIVQSLFSDLSLTRVECTTLVNDFKEQPVAFFAQLKTHVYDDTLLGLIRSVGVSNLIHHCLSKSFAAESLHFEHFVGHQLVRQIAQTLVKSSNISSHLPSKRIGD